MHEFQFQDPNRCSEPTTYYGRESGIGLAIESIHSRGAVRVGVIGLGCGTLAAFGRPADYFRFYEINPLVQEIAVQDFTFLRNSPSSCDVVMGDARLSMANEPDQNFDLLVLDAFNSDSIPTHLLTREAFAVYLRHLKSNGAILVHTSNRHLDLPPIAERLGQEYRLLSGFVRNRDDRSKAVLAAQWMLLTRDHSFFASAPIRPALKKLKPQAATVPL